MKAFHRLFEEKNDPIIEKADSLIRTANSTAASAFGPTLKVFPVLLVTYGGNAHQPDFVDRFSFMVTIACVFAAVEGLAKVDLEEDRRQAVGTAITKRFANWWA